MKNYPLGFAIIEWKSGGYSEALISNDAAGNRMFHAANWINTNLTPLDKWLPNIDNIITDFNDISEFFDTLDKNQGN